MFSSLRRKVINNHWTKRRGNNCCFGSWICLILISINHAKQFEFFASWISDVTSNYFIRRLPSLKFGMSAAEYNSANYKASKLFVAIMVILQLQLWSFKMLLIKSPVTQIICGPLRHNPFIIFCWIWHK